VNKKEFQKLREFLLDLNIILKAEPDIASVKKTIKEYLFYCEKTIKTQKRKKINFNKYYNEICIAIDNYSIDDIETLDYALIKLAEIIETI